MPVFVYVVSADQDFGGVDVTREEMIKWFGLAQVIDWEIETIIIGHRKSYFPRPDLAIRLTTVIAVKAEVCHV